MSVPMIQATGPSMPMPAAGITTAMSSATKVDRRPMPAEERVGVPAGDLEQPGREDALQHREDHDGEQEAPPVVPVEGEARQEEVRRDEPEERPRRGRSAARIEERDHAPSVAPVGGAPARAVSSEPRAASRASSSAWMADSMIGSSAPSITWSRLYDL